MPPALAATAAAMVLAMTGCERPLHRELPESLHRGLVESVNRELAGLDAQAESLITQQPASDAEEFLAPRREQLEALGGPDSYAGVKPDLEPDLLGDPQAEVMVNLQQAIETAVNNNLVTELARLQPQIAEADVVAAEAVFDALFFARVDHIKTDEPTAVPILRGIPLGTAANVSERTVFETGVRKRMIGGGSASVSTRLQRSRNKSVGFALTPDPAYLATVALGIEQPLLRGFGSDVNMAEIRFARNEDRRAIHELKRNLLDLVAQTEQAYWDLVLARRLLLIRERLLERGLEVRQRLERRQILDARAAEIADAISIVEQRRAEVISANRLLRATSDRLKVLLNDSQLTVGSEALINPIDTMVEAPIEYQLVEAISTAIDNRPEIKEAILSIDNASIGLTLADNARLPRLDVSARMEYFGLSDDASGAYGNVTEDSFIDYVLGLVFEQPIGNRAGEAGYRRARLLQSASVINYRRTVQDIVLDVKSALRDVVTNYSLIQARRTARLAATENLRVFQLLVENRLGYTPESLNLLFQRQDSVALTEAQEFEALANFNSALANFYRAMGVGLERNNIQLIVDQDGPG